MLDDEDCDSITDDCGESLNICPEDAQASVRHYNQVLETRLGGWRTVPGRSDPRSILHGL